MTFNKKTTSSKVASQASATLRDKNASEIAKRFAASALSQVQPTHQTGKAMEAEASQALKSDKYSSDTKTLAATLVSQSNKQR